MTSLKKWQIYLFAVLVLCAMAINAGFQIYQSQQIAQNTVNQDALVKSNCLIQQRNIEKGNQFKEAVQNSLYTQSFLLKKDHPEIAGVLEEDAQQIYLSEPISCQAP